MRTTGGLPKYGLTEVIFGICNSIVLHIGLDIIYLAFCCYLHLQFFNHHRFRADGILIPVLRQALSVVRHPKTKFRSPSSDRTFNAKSLTTHRTLQHICKAHKTHRTEANLAKELQLPTHGKQSAVRQNNATFL